jgi:predicted RNA-binding protein
MCEFKIIKRNDGKQILEDIVVLSYTEDNQLLLRDVIGMGDTLESALILDVNTLNQTCTVFEHELIQPFMALMKKFASGGIADTDIEIFQLKVDEIKKKV